MVILRVTPVGIESKQPKSESVRGSQRTARWEYRRFRCDVVLLQRPSMMPHNRRTVKVSDKTCQDAEQDVVTQFIDARRGAFEDFEALTAESHQQLVGSHTPQHCKLPKTYKAIHTSKFSRKGFSQSDGRYSWTSQQNAHRSHAV
ncbi:hypothetical protein CLF_101620 [Clonorchis sinensis]|uniref:Uncharacterized protein n=1 Tax=Clonorchis sinensis TaxID=79923 RepID=G7Y659_CLOSI|nr:hypothetical protein CLF_101620 [Clonorchis sinensis]